MNAQALSLAVLLCLLCGCVFGNTDRKQCDPLNPACEYYFPGHQVWGGNPDNGTAEPTSNIPVDAVMIAPGATSLALKFVGKIIAARFAVGNVAKASNQEIEAAGNEFVSVLGDLEAELTTTMSKDFSQIARKDLSKLIEEFGPIKSLLTNNGQRAATKLADAGFKTAQEKLDNCVDLIEQISAAVSEVLRRR